MILSQYHIFELDTINIYSVQQVAAGYACRVVPLSLSYQFLFLLFHLSLPRNKLDGGFALSVQNTPQISRRPVRSEPERPH